MLVSVIIPTQSRTGMLRQAAESVFRQTFTDFELILVPNAATSECVAVCNEIAAGRANVRVVELKRGHLAGARNAGIAAARGKWVSFLDDDDGWYPNKLAVQLELAAKTGAEMITSPAMMFSEHHDLGLLADPPPKEYALRQALTIYNFFGGSSSGALVRRDVIQSLGCFDERLPASEDWDMWRRIAWNHQIAIPDDYIVRYRVHAGSMSNKRWLMVRAEIMVLVKMIFDTPADLRPMVRKAWGHFAFRNFFHFYGYVNRKMFGVPSWCINRFRGALRRLRTAF